MPARPSRPLPVRLAWPLPDPSRPDPRPLDAGALPPGIDADDVPLGRFLSRREILAVFGLSAAALAAAACAPGAVDSGTAGAVGSGSPNASPDGGATLVPSATVGGGAIPSCVVVPALTEGPFYVDTGLERSDIRLDTTTGAPVGGAPLTLGWLVSMVDGDACVPLAGAVVDVWHCDAGGVYSGVAGTGGDFLRGVQRTDAAGAATFTTIYPGWYPGRAVHIHFKVRTDPDADAGFELTSQLFFDDALSRQVFASAPYAGDQDTPNDADGIFRSSDGTTLLAVEPAGDGYATTFSIALQLG